MISAQVEWFSPPAAANTSQRSNDRTPHDIERIFLAGLAPSAPKSSPTNSPLASSAKEMWKEQQNASADDGDKKFDEARRRRDAWLQKLQTQEFQQQEAEWFDTGKDNKKFKQITVATDASDIYSTGNSTVNGNNDASGAATPGRIARIFHSAKKKKNNKNNNNNAQNNEEKNKKKEGEDVVARSPYSTMSSVSSVSSESRRRAAASMAAANHGPRGMGEVNLSNANTENVNPAPISKANDDEPKPAATTSIFSVFSSDENVEKNDNNHNNHNNHHQHQDHVEESQGSSRSSERFSGFFSAARSIWKRVKTAVTGTHSSNNHATTTSSNNIPAELPQSPPIPTTTTTTAVRRSLADSFNNTDSLHHEEQTMNNSSNNTMERSHPSPSAVTVAPQATTSPTTNIPNSPFIEKANDANNSATPQHFSSPSSRRTEVEAALQLASSLSPRNRGNRRTPQKPSSTPPPPVHSQQPTPVKQGGEFPLWYQMGNVPLSSSPSMQAFDLQQQQQQSSPNIANTGVSQQQNPRAAKRMLLPEHLQTAPIFESATFVEVDAAGNPVINNSQNNNSLVSSVMQDGFIGEDGNVVPFLDIYSTPRTPPPPPPPPPLNQIDSQPHDDLNVPTAVPSSSESSSFSLDTLPPVRWVKSFFGKFGGAKGDDDEDDSAPNNNNNNNNSSINNTSVNERLSSFFGRSNNSTVSPMKIVDLNGNAEAPHGNNDYAIAF